MHERNNWCHSLQMYVDAPKGETIPRVVWTFSLPGLFIIIYRLFKCKDQSTDYF